MITLSGLVAAIPILEPNDVVFTEVGARLHLDDVQRDLSGVLDAVASADRNVGRFVFAQREDLVPTRDLRGARDYHPVLGAMMMQLQRKRRARLHDQALDLEPLAAVDAVVAA